MSASEFVAACSEVAARAKLPIETVAQRLEGQVDIQAAGKPPTASERMTRAALLARHLGVTLATAEEALSQEVA